MQVFELPQIKDLVGLDLAKARNWTNGRTGLVINPSVRKTPGTGHSNLYSLQDVYRFAIAKQFSGAGYAVQAIGKLLEALSPHLEKPIRANAVWTIWRPKAGGPFEVATSRTEPDDRMSVVLHIGQILAEVDAAILESQR
jgi:hypothetical protein